MGVGVGAGVGNAKGLDGDKPTVGAVDVGTAGGVGLLLADDVEVEVEVELELGSGVAMGGELLMFPFASNVNHEVLNVEMYVVPDCDIVVSCNDNPMDTVTVTLPPLLPAGSTISLMSSRTGFGRPLLEFGNCRRTNCWRRWCLCDKGSLSFCACNCRIRSRAMSISCEASAAVVVRDPSL
ncbi:hypothetical protein AA313_de0200872 [Arthrobotrys entomopaga]|nr:hypothetical protein AA313_de0200872 [Arthrobotrys entomopaga]